MLKSMNEYKFFKSFRIPVESGDDIYFSLELQDEFARYQLIEDAKLVDVSSTGLGLTSQVRLAVGSVVRVSIGFKRLKLDVEGSIVRSLGHEKDSELMLYGVEVDEEDQKDTKRFVEQYVNSFSADRAKDCINQLVLDEKFDRNAEGFEIFSLMLTLFKDISAFGNKESFVESMLEEVTRVLNAQRGTIFLINPESNELEAIAALGIDKNLLKFDYRKGIAGSVFTTGVPLNIDTITDKIRFSKEMDSVTGFETRSILCSPISNREDKVIGVIEILNKRNEQRFTHEDEKAMKVLSLLFSSVFHDYNPISEKSLIRRFSTPYDREFAYIGRSQSTNSVRRAIVRLKDIDSPLFILGDKGVGKKLLARIIHNEGKRGLNDYEVVYCQGVEEKDLELRIFGGPDRDIKGALESCAGGTVLFDEVSALPLHLQSRLIETLKEGRVEGSKLALHVRAIFTSVHNIGSLVKKGEFNQQLADYVTTSEFHIEPLAKRKQDVEDLLSYFLRKECRKQGLLLKEFSDDVKKQLVEYDWPGNVQELKGAVAKAVLYNPKAHIIESLDKGPTPIINPKNQALSGLDEIPMAKDSDVPLKERMALIEREVILTEIKRHNGNKSKAAKSMGISREALRKKLLQSDEILEKALHDSVDDIEKQAA